LESVFDPGEVLLFSPHLDDAAISCGMLLAVSAQAHVVTLLAGAPASDSGVQDWDARCGFPSSVAAMAQRRIEDRTAMGILDTRPHYEDFLDSQYGALPSADAVAAAMLRQIADWRPDTVLMPLGLHHCDHERVHEGALLAMRSAGAAVRWLAYEDLPYAARAGVVQSRLNALASAAVMATQVAIAPLWRNSAVTGQAGALKTRAIAAYASQLAAVGIEADAFSEPGSERYWLLQPNARESPAGKSGLAW